MVFRRGPENLDQLYLYVPRKSGRVVFTRGPENLDQLYFHLPRKSGVVVFTRGPDNLDQLYFVFTLVQKIWNGRSQEIWGVDLLYFHVPKKFCWNFVFRIAMGRHLAPSI
jgi:hypothetical protein